MFVAVLDDSSRCHDVLAVGEARAVVHDAAHPRGHGLVHEVDVLRVVEVDSDRHGGTSRETQRGQPDRLERAVVSDAVLADLQDDRQTGTLRACDDRLRMLEQNDVEGADTPSLLAGLPHNIDGCDRRSVHHVSTLPGSDRRGSDMTARWWRCGEAGGFHEAAPAAPVCRAPLAPVGTSEPVGAICSRRRASAAGVSGAPDSLAAYKAAPTTGG